MTGQQYRAKTSHRSRLEAELLKIGIRTDEDLREAIRNLPPLSIGIMTDPIATTQRKGVGVYG